MHTREGKINKRMEKVYGRNLIKNFEAGRESKGGTGLYRFFGLAAVLKRSYSGLKMTGKAD